MKTLFTYYGRRYRVSKDECGKDRFTKDEIIDALIKGDALVGGDHNHCLLRKTDGKVFAEILGTPLSKDTKLKEGAKVEIRFNGGATGKIVGFNGDYGPATQMYIVKLLKRTGQPWKDYKYSCVVLPEVLFLCFKK